MQLLKQGTYLLFFLAFISCRKENALDCFKSNGKEITAVRYPGEFSGIEVYDKMDVVIEQGAEYKVEVSAGDHIMKNISTKVSDGVLRLDNNNKCNFVRGYKRMIRVRITAPYVQKISNFGVGPITLSENFKQDKIFVVAENSGDCYINGTFDEVQTSSHGNGDMYFSGNTKKLLVYSYGTNYTRAENIKVSDYIYISTNSMGDAYFNLSGTELLDYMIWSDGNIYYTGKPHDIRNLSEVTAKGKALPKE